jgi:hypothetical protein
MQLNTVYEETHTGRQNDSEETNYRSRKFAIHPSTQGKALGSERVKSIKKFSSLSSDKGKTLTERCAKLVS